MESLNHGIMEPWNHQIMESWNRTDAVPTNRFLLENESIWPIYYTLKPNQSCKQKINLLRPLEGGHMRPRSYRSPEIFHERTDVKPSSTLHFEPESWKRQRGFGLSQGVHPHRTGLALNLQDKISRWKQYGMVMSCSMHGEGRFESTTR